MLCGVRTAREPQGDRHLRGAAGTGSCIDKNGLKEYITHMRRVSRLLLCLWLAVFAVGTAVHATAGTAMALDMAMASDAAMDMPGCAACDDDAGPDADSATCDINCTAPSIALLTSAPAQATFGVAQVLTVPDREGRLGRTGPPDPFPPKPIV